VESASASIERVVPFYDEHGIRLSRMLTDRVSNFVR
jgi:hypothetical protein